MKGFPLVALSSNYSARKHHKKKILVGEVRASQLHRASRLRFAAQLSPSESDANASLDSCINRRTP